MHKIVFLICFVYFWTTVLSSSYSKIKPYNSVKISSNGRIIDGYLAKAGEFPWQVAVYITGITAQTFCSGGLISPKYTLTAGHCTVGAIVFANHMGMLNRSDSNRDIIVTTQSFLHPEYSAETLENDIALIRFHFEANLTDYIKPIALKTDNGFIPSGIDVTVAGWGQISDSDPGFTDVLMAVRLKTISNKACQNIYGDAIKDSMLCAVGNLNEGWCTGDSGSPLTAKDSYGGSYLVGIASFLSANGCENPDPSGYARVSMFYDWINAIMSENA